MFLHYFNWHTQWLVCTTKSILCIGLKLIDGITFQSIVWEEWRLKILRMQPFKSKVCVWYYLKHYGTFWVKMCKNVVKFQAWKIGQKSQQIIASRELEIVNIFFYVFILFYFSNSLSVCDTFIFSFLSISTISHRYVWTFCKYNVRIFAINQ